jgi:hypothetical protein
MIVECVECIECVSMVDVDMQSLSTCMRTK